MVGIDEVGVAGIAIPHDRAEISGQDGPGVDVLGAASAGVHRGQKRGGRDVDILQPTRGVARGLIDVQHPTWRSSLRTRGRKVASSARASTSRSVEYWPTAATMIRFP